MKVKMLVKGYCAGLNFENGDVLHLSKKHLDSLDKGDYTILEDPRGEEDGKLPEEKETTPKEVKGAKNKAQKKDKTK